MNVEVHDYPCPFYNLTNIFTQEFYDRLVLETSMIPADHFEGLFEHNDSINDNGFTSRYRFLIQSNNDTPFWNEVHRIFTDHRLTEAISQRLDITVSNFTPTPIIYRDFPGYHISPHTDKNTKIITSQYYLPVDDEGKGMGTEFYHNKKGKLFKKLGFLPNSGYAFKRTDSSWHGVSPIDRKRSSLMVIYYTQEAKAKGWKPVTKLPD